MQNNPLGETSSASVEATTAGIHPASLIFIAYAILAGQENARATINQIIVESNDLILKLSEIDKANTD